MKYFCLLDVNVLLICDCLVSVVLFDAFFSAFNFTPFTLLFLQNKRLGGFLTVCSSIIDNGLFPTRLFKTRKSNRGWNVLQDVHVRVLVQSRRHMAGQMVHVYIKWTSIQHASPSWRANLSAAPSADISKAPVTCSGLAREPSHTADDESLCLLTTDWLTPPSSPPVRDFNPTLCGSCGFQVFALTGVVELTELGSVLCLHRVWLEVLTQVYH